MSTESGGVFQPLDADDPAEAGRYRLTARLGAGGMGKVYLSYTPAGRPVAVKVIRPEFAEDPEFRRRFRQEVQAAQRVHGLYTAPVIDSDAEGARPWLATAFVQGPTLSAAVAEHGPLPLPTVLLLVAGIAEALQGVHAAGLVHRDLKPSNVLLAADGPRVIDFGIARAADSTALTDSGVTIGTPAFMAPEQAAGREITPATDVFALGQVAAYAALGSPAYGDGPSHAVLYRIVHEEPDLSALPERLRPLVTGCLDKDPARRPSLARIVAMCQEASDETQLRRPDQWLPSAIAADIPQRHALPAQLPTAPDAPATYRPTQQAAPAPHAAPAQYAAPGQPRQPAQPHHQPTQTAPRTPPPGFAPPPAPTPPPGSVPPQHYRPTQHAAPVPGPPQYQRPPHQPVRTGGPYPPYQQQRPQGWAGPPPRRSRRGPVVLAVVGVIVALGILGAVLNALSGGGKDDNASRTGGGTGTSAPAPSSTGSGSGSRTPPAPTPERHPGVELADEYHVAFGDADLKPAKGLDDDFFYYCTTEIDPGCRFATNTRKLVLLDGGETGSLDTCLKDTRYTTQVDAARLSAGSQICASTDSAVALITFRRSSKSSEPSTYAVVDITVWRNAIPPTD
ncbi:serine/threonine-protein kinase [Streptomyces sp. HPF1205]|uniref:serine/threonine-protein kinase n=1 Tax=Streptomyces sp. HPF1205 TaxID=2873262 RepID=UPI001CEDBFEF|nr:serine/threonine protein kinase [Streptomyces sp. HPF1205]